MTPEALEKLVLSPGDPWELQRAFADLDEKARAKLSPTAQRLSRQFPIHATTLALVAVGPLSAVKKRGIHIWPHAQVAERILENRRPDWLDDLITHELDQDFTWLAFPTIRAWVKAGVCRKPTVDGYYRRLAGHLMRVRSAGRDSPPAPPISHQLLEDPDLLEDVPGIFKVETIAFNTNSWLRNAGGPDYETWPQAMVKLSADGRLDRSELLRLALAGLRLDMKENQLSGFHRFYAEMAPTPGELVQHQADYIGLLCHPVGHVARFAIDMLAQLEKQGILDTEPALREMQGVFARGGKGNAIAALKLVERITARSRGSARSAALATTTEALRHSHPDVQAKALELLEKNAGRLERTHLALIAELTSFVAASNRTRTRAIIAQSERAEAADGCIEEPPRADVVYDGARGEPDVYSPILGEITHRRVLFAEAELSPIASVDALLDTALHAVEVVDSPDEIELIVDAISRFAGQPPADFELRVAPLLHRLQHGRTGQNGLGARRIGVGLALIDLIFSWGRGQVFQTKGPQSAYYSQDDAFVPMIAHLRVVAQRAARREGRLLLSTPTHRGGWIDPIDWVGRLHELGRLPDLDHTMDFRLSLLRLAPDNRAEALARSASLPWSLRGIVAFALGGEAEPARRDFKASAAWISAARCRAPLADWGATFAPLGLVNAWPDGVRPAIYSWSPSHTSEQLGRPKSKTPQLHFAVGCRGERAKSQFPVGLLAPLLASIHRSPAIEWSELPSAALCRQTEPKRFVFSDLDTTWVAQWLAYVWPQNPAGAQMKGASRLVQRIDDDGSSWTPGFGFLHSLFQKEPTVGRARTPAPVPGAHREGCRRQRPGR